MDQNPLVAVEIDAWAELVRQFQDYMPVESAFWLNPSDEGRWSLYIASEKIEDTNFDLAHCDVMRIVNEMKTPYLDPFQVKLIGTGDPLPRAAVEVIQRYPGPMA